MKKQQLLANMSPLLILHNNSQATLNTITSKHFIAKVNNISLEMPVWSVQVTYGNISIKTGLQYKIRFRCRSSDVSKFNIGISKNENDWSSLGFYKKLDVDKKWKLFEFRFIPLVGHSISKFHFDIGDSNFLLEIKDLEITEQEIGILTNKPKRTLIIAATPRCGSNLLCDYLYRTNKLGDPKEYFDDDIQRHLTAIEIHRIQNLINSPVEYLDNLIANTSSNHVFSFKVMWEHFTSNVIPIVETTRIAKSNCNSITEFFNPTFIYIKRNDIFLQAVSLYIALKTNKWSKTMEKNYSEQEFIPHYNYSEIKKCLELLRSDYSNWENYFSKNNIDYVTIVYEELVNDPVKTLTNLFRRISFENIHIDEDVLNTSFFKQSNALNDEFLVKFHQEYSNEYTKLEG
jgi:trehalose 2-sulfotransferase